MGGDLHMHARAVREACGRWSQERLAAFSRERRLGKERVHGSGRTLRTALIRCGRYMNGYEEMSCGAGGEHPCSAERLVACAIREADRMRQDAVSSAWRRSLVRFPCGSGDKRVTVDICGCKP
jgi:hypothetical protein